MSNEEQKILSYLKNNAQGKANKKTSNEIQQATGLPAGGNTNEFIREVIRKLIYNGALIGSDNGGYWIIQNKNELEAVVNGLNSRAKEIQERANALQGNWENINE